MSTKSSPRATIDPQRGEIWRVAFDPTTGQEIQKTRPAVVITAPGVGLYELEVVVPIREWKKSFSQQIWMVKLSPAKMNGLSKDSAVDVFQVKSVSIKRFDAKIGNVTADELDDIVAAVALVIGYNP